MLDLALNAQFARDMTARAVRPAAQPAAAPEPPAKPVAARTRRTTGRVLHALAARIEPRSTFVRA